MNRRLLLRLLGTIPTAMLTARESAAASGLRAPSRKPERPVVAIDPGHGGHDPGAIGLHGTYEKNVTLDIAQRVALALERRGDIVVVLTRRDDRFLALDERVERAREAKARLFVSVHADSAPNRDARGLSAYTLSEKASDDFADALARQENKADELGGVDIRSTRKAIRDILVDLAARHTRHAALVAREALVIGAGRRLKLLDRPMRAANFAVLKAPDVPSVLVETGFLSNPADEEMLRDPDSRRIVAEVLAQQISAIIRRPPFA